MPFYCQKKKQNRYGKMQRFEIFCEIRTPDILIKDARIPDGANFQHSYDSVNKII